MADRQSQEPTNSSTRAQAELPVRPGVTLPGLGEVRRVRSLTTLFDRLLGKYHKDTTLYLVTTVAGRRFKLVVVSSPQANTAASSRTERAAERLRRFEPAGCVPAVRYVDSRRLILDFVEGRTLAELPLGPERAGALGRFIAARQVPVEPHGPGMPRFEKLLDRLHNAGLLEAEALPKALAAGARIAELDEAPRALCFSDSALKNYVEDRHGDLRYIDAFGIKAEYLGAALVRQAASFPPANRPAFLEAYFSATPHARHLSEHLPEYCIHHLIERAAKHLPQPQAGATRTARRNRQRRRVLVQTTARLHEALALPRDPAAFRRWLEQVGE